MNARNEADRKAVSVLLMGVWNSNLSYKPTELGPHVTALLETAEDLSEVKAYLSDLPQRATEWPKPVEMRAAILAARAERLARPARGDCASCDGHGVVGFDRWQRSPQWGLQKVGYAGDCPDCRGGQWPIVALDHFRAWQANGRRVVTPREREV